VDTFATATAMLAALDARQISAVELLDLHRRRIERLNPTIRVPAAFCGVFGHRPSETALPRSGQFPFPPMPNRTTLRFAALLEREIGGFVPPPGHE
jgi:Asp-tRNA(Asn)/Glu-tRNA(Gln) amidotransferase A subunit family amidase